MATGTVSAGQGVNLGEYLAREQKRIEAVMAEICPPDVARPATIHRAMRYSLMAGGKRIRPILCLEAARAIKEDVTGLDPAAISLELIHTYSLIHDDLPALDNDDFRRGKATNHRVFGEAMAILAGDALLTLAFHTLTQLEGCPAEVRVRLLDELATASGTVDGMIGGQVADLEGEGQPATAELLEYIHRAKTGALLRASIRMGAIWAGASERQLEALTNYGEHIGLAFQIVDDLLDVEESSEALGKTAGKDVHQGKITFPAVYGRERSREMAQTELKRALDALTTFGASAERLREIAEMIVSRKS